MMGARHGGRMQRFEREWGCNTGCSLLDATGRLLV